MSFDDGYIHVEYSHMNNAADDMVAQTKAIADILSNLEQEIAVLKANWFGVDADIYRGKQQAWDSALGALERLLDSHASTLNDIAGGY